MRRLTLVYGLIWSCLLCTLLYLGTTALDRSEKNRVQSLLAADWNAMKGYLRIENGKPMWYFDNDDQDEALLVSHLRQSLILTDAQGKVFERPPAAVALGSAENHLLIHRGELRDESGVRHYYAVLTRPAPANRFPTAWLYLYLAAIAISFLLTAEMLKRSRSIVAR